MDEPEDADDKAKRPKQHQAPPGWMHFSVAVQHVQDVRGVSKSEAARLLREADRTGWIRSDSKDFLMRHDGYLQIIRQRSGQIYGYMRGQNIGPKLFGPDVWKMFPSKTEQKTGGRKPHPARDPVIEAAAEWFDEEGLPEGNILIIKWMINWINQKNLEEPSQSTFEGWAEKVRQKVKHRRSGLTAPKKS